MSASRSKAMVRVLVAATALVAAYFGFVRECAYGGGMAAAYRECKCLGLERVVYDHTAADGPRKSLCIGIVTSGTCYAWMGGPEIDCRDRRPSR